MLAPAHHHPGVVIALGLKDGRGPVQAVKGPARLAEEVALGFRAVGPPSDSTGGAPVMAAVSAMSVHTSRVFCVHFLSGGRVAWTVSPSHTCHKSACLDNFWN